MTEIRPLRTGDPERIGPYRLTGFLGRGGQGAVFLGEAEDGSRAAVKVLDAEWAEDPEYRRRFVREAAAARRVASFCTAQVVGADVHAERPYIASEYVPGPTLREAVEKDGPRTGADLERLAVATATALAAVHGAGIEHRDLKPGNVLLAPDGPRVIDFGIARVADVSGTHSGSLIGTPGYMAPERIAGEPAGSPAHPGAADVFSWGAVMLYAATGRAAFEGDSVPNVMHRVLHEDPDLSGVEEPLRGLLARCLSKDPERRPDSSELLLDLLGRPAADSGPAAGPTAAAAEPETAPETGSGRTGGPGRDGAAPGSPAAPRTGRRALRPALLSAAALVLLAAALGGYLALGPGAAPPQERPAAAAASDPGRTDGAAEPGASPSEPGAASASATASSGKDRDGDGEKPEDDAEGEDGGGEESPEPDGPVFPDAFAGSWTGTDRDGGTGHVLTVPPESRTASLVSGDGECTWSFTAVRKNDRGGYNATMTSDRGCGPHTTSSLWIEEGTLLVHMHGVPGNHEAKWFDLTRG